MKTDRRDAELLVRLLLAGKLHAVRVPGAEEEALRDLVRAREQVRVDLVRCRHRLSKLLLRHGIRFEDGDAWTDRHRAWLNGIVLEWPAAQATLLDVRGAIDALTHRRDGLERQIVSMLPSSPWRSQVGVLRCLRGVDTLTAVGLCAEVGDFTRFGRAEQLMSYLGLVPSENTTGQQRRLGSITKTGSAHARRLLVEAAWQYAATRECRRNRVRLIERILYAYDYATQDRSRGRCSVCQRGAKRPENRRAARGVCRVAGRSWARSGAVGGQRRAARCVALGARTAEEIAGPDGLLGQLTRRLLNRALEAELSEHLGYEPGQAPPGGVGNARNGQPARRS